MRAVAAVIAALVALIAALAAAPAAAADLGPVVPAAKPGTHCVADPALMRRDHMVFLKHQRDVTVHQGIQGKFSLTDCVDCHASAATGSVAAAPGDFCVSCHRYAAVSIDCFECHATKPRAVAARKSP
jgi:hypothetical protein